MAHCAIDGYSSDMVASPVGGRAIGGEHKNDGLVEVAKRGASEDRPCSSQEYGPSLAHSVQNTWCSMQDCQFVTGIYFGYPEVIH
jgi:hypothetical protein